MRLRLVNTGLFATMGMAKENPLTIDERIQALTTNLELESHMREDLRKNHEEFISRMTAYAADVRDAITRLTNIAEAHSIQLDDHKRRIDDLEK